MAYHIGNRRNRTHQSFIVLRYVAPIAAFVLVLFAVRVSASPWSNVTPPTYDPNFVVPLNTTSNAQTKLGHVSVQQHFYAGGITVGSAASPMTICWNGTDPAYCRDEWIQAGILNYATLQNDATRTDDIGSPLLLGLDDTSIATFGLRSVAPDETDAAQLPGVGVEGVAADDIGLVTAGVAVSTGSDTNDHFGIYATNGGNKDIPAAQFDGNVGIRGAFGESALFIGPVFDATGNILPSLQFFRENNKTAVCLNGVCKSAWDSAGPSEWVLNTATTPNTLWPGNASRGLSIGKGMFTVTREADLTATTTINGSLAASTMSIGNAPAGLPLSMTCGDGFCSQGESAVSCPDDCDTAAPAHVTIDAISQPKPSQYIALFVWQNPPETDFAGVRIVYSPTVPPSGPDGGTSHIDIFGTPNGTSSYATPSLGIGQHFFYLYSYDNDRYGQPHNFSEPVMEHCTIPSSGNGACTTSYPA